MEAEKKAARFRDMHKGPGILILPTVWDAAGARICESAGFSAVGTTSAGIAFSLGLPDGGKVGRDAMLERVAHISAAVQVPVSADLERGFATTPEGTAETVRRAIQAGIVGVNIGDGTGDDGDPLVELSLAEEKIRAARETADLAGIPIVINARVDAYAIGGSDPAALLDTAVRRGNAYRRAGADCIFIPFLTNETPIPTLVRDIDAPINVMAVRTMPPVKHLEKMGVKRVSLGSGLMRASMGLIQRIARELLETGTYSALIQGAFSYTQAKAFFSGTPSWEGGTPEMREG